MCPSGGGTTGNLQKTAGRIPEATGGAICLRDAWSDTMKAPLRIAFFGSSLVSAWWNGAATYYRGILKALHERGHQVTFFEPDAFDRQHHRDIDDPPYARVVVYRPDTAGADEALEQACN